MTNSTTLLLFIVSIMSIHNVSAQSCCNPGATAQFAALTTSKGFKAAHAEPRPLHFTATSGSTVHFACKDGKDGQAFLVPSAKKSDKVVFMIHEWWGLNDYIKREAEALQQELGDDVSIMALDLYDGNVATTREVASKLMSEANETRIKNIINGAIQHVGPTARVATVGWCFGGGWSLQSTLLLGTQAAACVMYYGMPESDEKKLTNLSAPVLFILANKDKWITPNVAHAFEERMKRLSKPVTVRAYEADHAFANPSNPIFDKEAAADAHKHTVQFIQDHLK